MNLRQVLPKDAIPSVDDPSFGSDYEGDSEEVIVVDGDPARAYPIGYLHYHEIVNDVVDGDPLAVTWCPLCGSVAVYERTVDGRVLTFGVSGKLADDDLVMYDRETGSEWKQSLGEAIGGELAGSKLSVRPMTVTAWETFREHNPDGVVLQSPGGASEAASDTDDPAPVDYDERPYEEYFDSDGFGLAAHRDSGDTRSWDRKDIDPKAVVLGVEVDDEAIGFPLERVRTAGGVVTETVGGRSVVVCATDEGIHAFENPGFEFGTAGESGFRADGTRWNGATGDGADGRQLDRIPARRLFAFAWQDDHGPESFYDPD